MSEGVHDRDTDRRWRQRLHLPFHPKRRPDEALAPSGVVLDTAERNLDKEAVVPDLPTPPDIGRPHPGRRRLLPEASWASVPAIEADAGELGELWLAAATAIGASHADDPSGSRQDRYAYAQAGRFAIAAVADGVSSYARSGAGAQAAVETVCAYIARLPGDNVGALVDGGHDAEKARAVLAAAVGAASDRLRELGRDHGGPEQLSTTLVLAVVEATSRGMRAVAARVGDSSAYAAEPQGVRRIFSSDSPRAPLRNALPLRRDVLDVVEVAHCEFGADDALLLVSDGVGHDLESSANAREWITSRLQRQIPTGLDAHAAISYARQGSADDRTLLAVRTHGNSADVSD